MGQLFTLMFLLLRLAGKFVKDLYILAYCDWFSNWSLTHYKFQKFVLFSVNLVNKEKRARREKLGQNSWKFCLTKLFTPHSTNKSSQKQSLEKIRICKEFLNSFRAAAQFCNKLLQICKTRVVDHKISAMFGTFSPVTVQQVVLPCRAICSWKWEKLRLQWEN